MSSVQLLRNTRLWVSTAKGSEAITKNNTWEVMIQEDFSFSYNSNTSDITLSEAGPAPTRGSARFNQSMNPADWNFSTYIRPYLDDKGNGDSSDDQVLTPDYALWHALASGSPLDLTTSGGVTSNKTNMLVKFGDNQYHELTKLTLFYLVDKQWYKITDVQIGQAEINFDIEGIAMTTWTGQGTRLEPLGSVAPFDHLSPDFTMPDKIFNCAAYIKNKLTILKITDNSDGEEYDIAITGGSLTINNNITYLTPSTLSRVDTPIGSFTGTFDVSGSVEAYLRSASPLEVGTKKYVADLIAKLLPTQGNDCSTRQSIPVKNSFKVALCIGGVYTQASPGFVVVLPTAHLSSPSIETADVLGTSIEFKGQPTELSAGDEVYIGTSPKYTKNEIDALIASGDGENHYLPDPTITTQPTNQTVAPAGTLTLTVLGTNIARAQWYKDGQPIPGATATTYTKSGVTTAAAGKYKVVVFNSGGESVTSNEVTVTVS
ncbi:tail protein [Vibrio phage phi 3]|uniref:Major tail protein n=1 Tax=Vibrio phage phi 3 TaxID=1589298 RepID=A0A0B5GYW4_9CAUD|nr:tail protein [Vibrio phage phi 3]AJF40901.1 major tail protein [Vibrio phage phi 3]